MAKKKQKPKHGGAREGAGRPCVYDEDLTFKGIRMPTSLVERIQKKANNENVSFSRCVNDLLTEVI